LVLDPASAFNLVQLGPAADSTDLEALTAFQELWGSKSEMRRFKDGRIAESVVWDVKTADERAHVPAMVVRHILQWHFGLGEEHVQTWQSAYDSVIRMPKEIATQYIQGAGSSMGFKGAMQAFDRLVKAVKALDDELPLSLVNASPISESLRYTSTFSPVPLPEPLAAALPPNARYLQPINIVFEFEQSAKWPDELKAIQKIKLAFFESIGTGLMKSVEGLKASVVLGSGNITDSNELMDKAYLEIVTPEGWAFHARIWHNREATLLDRILDDNGPNPHVVVSKKRKQHERKGKEYLDALEAKEVYDRRFIHAPRHHRAVAALNHQYAAFSGTCRLVKRWFASHWFLGGHVSEEVVELLCAQFFVLDGKHVGTDVDIPKKTLSVVPSTKERGFAMVMRFLSEWKWEEGGLWVCLYGPKKAEGEEEGDGAPAAPKTAPAKASGAGVWTVSTDMDKDGKSWTRKGPDVIVAKRIRAIAGATWNYMQTMEDGTFNVQGMFIHPTQDYDFLVHLNPSVIPRYVHNIAADEWLLGKGKFANDRLRKQEQDLILPGFDPARSLFDDLQRTYADTFRIFFDPYGGDTYGAVWDPTLKESRPFRVLGGYSSVPVKKVCV
jgi:U3 small nucleolar RNA-associated protein 22